MFCRVTFIALTDIGDIGKITVKEEDGTKWPVLVVLQSLSELMSVAMTVTVIYLTYKIEQMIDAFYIHGSKVQIR